MLNPMLVLLLLVPLVQGASVCVPLARGCRCTLEDGTVQKYDDATRCNQVQQTVNNKKQLNQEIQDKFGNFRDNCFPKPSGGCKCNEKDRQGNDVVTVYNNPSECRARVKRDSGVAVQRNPSSVNINNNNKPSQNVRDPVRERAEQNYRAVVDELNTKFKGLKENCYPRPKGCLCVIGKTAEGRDITERRMKDTECKCQAGERGPGCPAA